MLPEEMGPVSASTVGGTSSGAEEGGAGSSERGGVSRVVEEGENDARLDGLE